MLSKRAPEVQKIPRVGAMRTKSRPHGDNTNNKEMIAHQAIQAPFTSQPL